MMFFLTGHLLPKPHPGNGKPGNGKMSHRFFARLFPSIGNIVLRSDSSLRYFPVNISNCDQENCFQFSRSPFLKPKHTARIKQCQIV